MGDSNPTPTIVQVVDLAADPRCFIEFNSIAVVDQSAWLRREKG